MGLKDKLAKSAMKSAFGEDAERMSEKYQVSQSPEVQQLLADAKARESQIDYAELAKTAQAAQAMGGSGTVFVGPSAEQIALANLAQKLVQWGVETPGVITKMTPTGKTDATGSSEHEITVTVTPADGEGYETTINQYLLPSAEFKEGGGVVIRVDPDDRMKGLLWGTR